VLRLKATSVEHVPEARDATIDWIAQRFPGQRQAIEVSVAERTREIGIRKAVGARPRDVLLHFLAESLAISTLGSLVGALLGAVVAIGSTAIFRELTGAGIFPVFTIDTLGWVVLSAAVVGVAFGTYPARLAARLTPVEAIQRE
jgi:putative ABC transport system permease protein